MPGGLAPLPAALPLAGGLGGVFRTSIEIRVRAMCYSRQELAFGRSLALQFIGDDHTRYVR
jgi:hypothetical protein